MAICNRTLGGLQDQSYGFSTCNPSMGVKCWRFRVASRRLCRRAVAAIRASARRVWYCRRISPPRHAMAKSRSRCVNRASKCWTFASSFEFIPIKPTVCLSHDSANMLSDQSLPTSIQWWRGHGQEAKRGEAGWHRITRNVKRLGRFSSRV
jgi:hypothetical protein